VEDFFAGLAEYDGVDLDRRRARNVVKTLQNTRTTIKELHGKLEELKKGLNDRTGDLEATQALIREMIIGADLIKSASAAAEALGAAAASGAAASGAAAAASDSSLSDEFSRLMY